MEIEFGIRLSYAKRFSFYHEPSYSSCCQNQCERHNGIMYRVDRQVFLEQQTFGLQNNYCELKLSVLVLLVELSLSGCGDDIQFRSIDNGLGPDSAGLI